VRELTGGLLLLRPLEFKELTGGLLLMRPLDFKELTGDLQYAPEVS